MAMPSASAAVGAVSTCTGLVVWAVYTHQALDGTLQAVKMARMVENVEEMSRRVKQIAIAVVVGACVIIGILAISNLILSSYVNKTLESKSRGKNLNVSSSRAVVQAFMQAITFTMLMLIAALWLLDAGWFVVALVAKHSTRAANSNYGDLLSFVDEQIDRKSQDIVDILEAQLMQLENFQGLPAGLTDDLIQTYHVVLKDAVGNVTINNFTLDEWNTTLSYVGDTVENVIGNLFSALLGNGLQLFGQALLLCAATAHFAQLVQLRSETIPLSVVKAVASGLDANATSEPARPQALWIQ